MPLEATGSCAPSISVSWCSHHEYPCASCARTVFMGQVLLPSRRNSLSPHETILPPPRPDGLFQKRVFTGPVGAVECGFIQHVPALCPPARCRPVGHARKQAEQQSNHHSYDRSGERRLIGHQEDNAEQNGSQRLRHCPQDRIMGTLDKVIGEQAIWRLSRLCVKLAHPRIKDKHIDWCE